MPFTPIHMGPGIFVKALLQGSFSLMVFGWTQIIMDIQPLVVMLTGEGHLHGFTHSYVGATLIAIGSALTGKYAAELCLRFIGENRDITIAWPVAFVSAFIGSFSHVLLDSIMHADVQPFAPIVTNNPFQDLISVSTLHTLCLYSGLIGALLYYVVSCYLHKHRAAMLKQHRSL